MEVDVLAESLRQLVRHVQREVAQAVSRGQLEYRQELYWTWKPDAVEYTPAGVHIQGSSSQYIVKRGWLAGPVAQVIMAVREADPFQVVTEQIVGRRLGGGTLSGEPLKRFGMLVNFVNTVSTSILTDSGVADADVDRLVDAFIKELLGQPLKHRARVELHGLVLLVPSIQFRDGDVAASVRQPTTTDLEQELSGVNLSFGEAPPYTQPLTSHILPSAILEMEMLANMPAEVYARIQKLLAVLRLFGPAGIDYISCRISSESTQTGSYVRSIGSGYSAAEKFGSAWGKYQVKESDEVRLQKFVDALVSKLPSAIYEQKEIEEDAVTFAYRRYCDALFHRGSWKERIADAVMGVEALFAWENAELNYRLPLRVARVIPTLGYRESEVDLRPLRVREALRAGYDVRSKFVHGAQPEKATVKAIKEDFGGWKPFFSMIVTILRLSLVTIVTTGLRESLRLVDDSFIDDSKKAQLHEKLEPAREAIAVCL